MKLRTYTGEPDSEFCLFVLAEDSLEMPESKVHSFIVKLWLEEADHEENTGGWHGHITHVPSGQRRYLQDLPDILSFVRPYVAEIGPDATLVSWFRRWLQSWMRRKR